MPKIKLIVYADSAIVSAYEVLARAFRTTRSHVHFDWVWNMVWSPPGRSWRRTTRRMRLLVGRYVFRPCSRRRTVGFPLRLSR